MFTIVTLMALGKADKVLNNSQENTEDKQILIPRLSLFHLSHPYMLLVATRM